MWRHSRLLLLLLSSMLLSLPPLIAAANAVGEETTRPSTHFLEAPFFSNSPECPLPAAAGDTHCCCRDGIVNIAMTLDAAYLRGSMAAVLSILHHSACPHNLHFHFIHSGDDDPPAYLHTVMASSFPFLHFDMHAFSEDTVAGLISTSVRRALDRPLNYARSYLPSLLPDCLRRVIYLDSDVIVVDDIAELWSTRLHATSTVAAPEYCEVDMGRYFTATFWSTPALAAALEGRRSRACYFNTGVMVVELERWRARGHTREIEEWMEVQKRMRIYELGSLPPFLLVFAGEITAVEARWNQHGLGGDNYEGHCRGLHAGKASLLHWSGRGKPWVRIDGGWPCPVDALWAPYDMLRRPSPPLEY